MNVGEYCNRDVICINFDKTPLEAARIMRSQHTGCVVVIEEQDGRPIPISILTDRDITLEIVAEEVDPSMVSVLDLNRRSLVKVNEKEDLTESIAIMKSKGVRRVPVVDDDGGLVGILALDDYIDYLAEQLNSLVTLFSRESKNEKAFTNLAVAG